MTSKRNMNAIRVEQDRQLNLRRQLAGRTFYSRAKMVHFGGASLAIALALVSPLVLLFAPKQGPTLGAVAGAWIFVSRLLLEPLRHRFQRMGATAQEHFDCAVLGTGWNEALASQLSEEEIRSASKKLERKVARLRQWYPANANVDWPRSVLICQRSNAVWARRQHVGYGWTLVAAAAGWVAVGIIVAVADGASLAEYLTTIALPSLPAVLDAAEVSKQHRQAADRRRKLQKRFDELLDSAADEKDLRELQDQLFTLRRDGPLIPDWFYKIVRGGYEEDMKYAAEQLADSGPREGAE